MKHHIRNFSVALFAWSGVTTLYRVWSRRQGPLVRVIAFHDVHDTDWFETVISSLTREFQVITPLEFEMGAFSRERINVLISFDDGYASWVERCAPILHTHGVHALFFINSGLLDISHDHEKTDAFVSHQLKLSPKKPLTWEGAETLNREGHTIGGHTAHHVSLRNVPAEVVRSEVGEDKRVIEEKLGIRISHFAYPFGALRDYSHETERIIHECGYSFVYIAEPGFVRSGERHIPRTLIEKGQSYRDLRRWIYGSYDLFVNLKRLFGSSREYHDTY
jgi:peptidoglycan/xylan/chitin deacetylase (PgdA/CDA1 family)